jgi:hypothetical protein
MSRRRPTGKFVGTSEECFADLFKERTRQERYALHRLLSDFCDVQQEAVSQWERGLRQIRGISLVRLRCFLHLAGYEVTEVDGYQEPVRSLLLIVGMGITSDDDQPPLDLNDLEVRLGYERSNNLKSLYGIILRNEGYSKEVGIEMRNIVAELQERLDDKMRDMRKEIARVLKELKVEPATATLNKWPAPSEPASAILVTSFTRSIALTLALAKGLEGNPASIKAAIQATRGGIDMHELKELLEEFLR